MLITAIIVTYSNRFHLLKQVIESCQKEGINKILVVDNNSEKSSKKNLEDLRFRSNNIYVIWNPQNLGSASAFKSGLKYAIEYLDNEYIMLLDDDNKPASGCVKKLQSYWTKKSAEVSCLLSYRPDREIYKQAVKFQNPKLVLGRANSFYGFHIWGKLLKIIPRKNNQNTNKTIGEVACAPYGGMFFHKSLIDEIGYPDDNFFLYSDDHDWSYRITANKKKIILLLNSIIQDIDKSWAISEKQNNIFQSIRNGQEFRVYYTIRNRIVFETRYLVNNKAIYYLNKIVFSILLFLYCGNKKVFRIYLTALRHAKQNHLGKTFEDLNS